MSKYGVLLLCILSVITSALYYKCSHMKSQLIPETEQYLISTLDERSNEIYSYLDQQEKLINSLARDQKIINMFMGDIKNIDKNTRDVVVQLYHELAAVKNIIFIEHNGEIIASMENQKDLKGKNILKEPWNTSGLSESFMRSSMTLTTDISAFEFNQLLKRPALFLTTPIINNKSLYGCILIELDIEPIYLMLRKYIGLKSTGEVALGRIENGKVMYVAPTRHSPNMLFKSLEDTSDSLDDDKTYIKQTMRRAIFDEKGSGKVLDYRGQNVIAAWSYITKLDWGIVAKIDTDEILAQVYPWYLFFLLFLISTLLLSVIMCIYMKDNIIQFMHISNISYAKIARIFLWVGVVISIITFLTSIYHLHQNKSASITKAMKKAKKKAALAADRINDNIGQIESVVQALADDLTSGILPTELVEKRIMTELRENPSLIGITIAHEPYAYNKNTKLYAFTIGRTQNDGSLKKSYFGDIYDYTTPSSPGEPLSDWYIQALKKGGVWLNPRLEPYTNQPSITYAVPFFNAADKKPRGVVAISYDLQAVQKIIDEIKIGETGYGFAMSRNGTLITFPTQSYVSNQKSFMSLSQEKADAKLMALAERTLTAKKPFHDNFFDTKINQLYFIYITQIAMIEGSIAIIFGQDEVSMSSLDVRHSYFIMLICLILGLLCLAALGCNIEQSNLLVIRKFSALATLILFLALIVTWKIVISTKTPYDTQKNGTVIVDQSQLNKFLNEVKENASNSQSDEPQPLFMPTGIHIYSFSLPRIQNVTLSGNIWQKLDLSVFKDIPQEVHLPKDITLSFKELTKNIENNTEVRVSNFDATVFNEQDLSHFPFDITNIKLNLSSKDLARNIILIPDLGGYNSINPSDKPGIDKDFTLPGFDIEKSFFSLKKLTPDSDFGLNSFRAITEHYDLIYNIVITRKLLNPFILYILPLIVILIALFATLFSVRESKNHNPLAPLGAYASTFFGLVILHRIIRTSEQYAAAGTLYMEYAFFYTYITILFLVLHTIIVYGPNSNKTFDEIITPLAVYFYWPIQLFLWLATTICVFY